MKLRLCTRHANDESLAVAFSTAVVHATVSTYDDITTLPGITTNPSFVNYVRLRAVSIPPAEASGFYPAK